MMERRCHATAKSVCDGPIRNIAGACVSTMSTLLPPDCIGQSGHRVELAEVDLSGA